MLPFDFATTARVACETRCKRAGLAAAVALAAGLALVAPVRLAAQEHAAAPPPAAGQSAAGHETPAADGASGGAAEPGGAREESPWGFIGKIVNFAILAGTLVYFLRAPFTKYLVDRSAQIRNDLVTAAQLKDDAGRQIAEIEAKLGRLPGELDTLRAKGRDEIAAEGARIRETAAAERDRLLEQTRREIDLQLRTARRDLVTHAADLAVQVARARIRERITSDDQARLVDRYLSQVKTND